MKQSRYYYQFMSIDSQVEEKLQGSSDVFSQMLVYAGIGINEGGVMTKCYNSNINRYNNLKPSLVKVEIPSINRFLPKDEFIGRDIMVLCKGFYVSKGGSVICPKQMVSQPSPDPHKITYKY